MAKKSNLVNIAASIGIMDATWELIVGTIIAFVLIVVGVVNLFRKLIYTKEVMATVRKVVCIGNKCTIDIKYSVDNDITVTPIPTNTKIYEKSLETTSTNLKENDTIRVYVNPTDFNQVSLQKDVETNSGSWFIIGIGLFIFALSLGSWMLAKKNKYYAIYQGLF
jgi:hypothetical protein